MKTCFPRTQKKCSPSPVGDSVLISIITPQISLSLFPDEDILTKEIESWEGFADRLPEEDRVTLAKILNDCYKCSKAINAKGKPFSTEPVIMALLFSQHQLIEWLEMQFSKNRE